MMKPYYEDSGVTLYQGDWQDVLPTLDVSRPCIITDPPYLTDETGVSIAIPGGVGERIEESNSVGMPWGYSLDWVDAFQRFAPSHWVVFCNYRMLGGLQVAIEAKAKLQTTFVWRKTNAPRMTRPVPRLDCEFALWFRDPKSNCGRMGLFQSMVIDVPMPQAGCFATERILEGETGKAAHPCQKPLAVVQPFVDRLCDPSDLVIDPFAGTGTTLLAAKMSGIRAIGIEQKESYCELIANRLRQGVLFGAEAACP